MEKYKSEKENLKQDYASLTDSNDHNVEKGIELKRQLDKIEHLTKDLESNKQSAENKYGSLKGFDEYDEDRSYREIPSEKLLVGDNWTTEKRVQLENVGRLGAV